MDDRTLRTHLIRLAHANPELRSVILPILKDAGDGKPDSRSVLKEYQDLVNALNRLSIITRPVQAFRDAHASFKAPMETLGDLVNDYIKSESSSR